MEGNHCRLFDENLVRNIMVSTGLSILEYIRQHGDTAESEIRDFVMCHSDSIIWNTIEYMNGPEKRSSPSGDDEEADFEQDPDA
jgi:hypothetical protein